MILIVERVQSWKEVLKSGESKLKKTEKLRKEDNMKKILKLILLVCVVFSQISSPVKVIAEEILADIPSIETIGITGNADNKILTVSVDGNNFLIATEDEEPVTTSYIVKTLLTFTYVNGEVETDVNYQLVTGTEINEGSVIAQFENFGYGYNGKYTVDVEVFDVTGATFTDTDSDTLSKYVESNQLSSMVKDSESIEEDKIDTGVVFEVTGDVDEKKDETDPENPVTYYETKDSGNVTFNINLDKGNLSDDIIENGYYKVVINNNLTLHPYNFELKQDFSKLLNGDYTITVYFINEEDSINLATTLLIKNAVGNSDYKTYYNGEITDVYNKVISSTILTEEQKAELTNVDFNRLTQIVTVDEIDERVEGNYFFDKYNEETISIINRLNGIFKTDSVSGVKVSDYLNKIANDEYFKGFNVTITDAYGYEVAPESLVGTGMKLTLSYGDASLNYTFVVSGDVNDGLVTGEEVNTALNSALELQYLDAINMYALDINEDGVVDLLDVTKMAGSIDVGTWVNHNGYNDSVNSTLELNKSNNEVIRAGDTFKVDYVLSGLSAKNIELNGIEGIINYDRDVLDLVGISSSSLNEYSNYNYSTSKYIYASNTVLDEDSVVLTFTFKAKMEQTTNINMTNERVAVDGTEVKLVSNSDIDVKIARALSTNNDITSLTSSIGTFDKPFDKDVLEYTLYVDYWVKSVTFNGVLGDEYASTLAFKEYALTGDTTVITLPVVAENGDIKSYIINVVKVYPKSTNNYLSKLEIEGYEIDFDKDTLEYSIKVSSDVETLDITAVAEDSSARVNIYGNSNFKEGENKVTVVVTAEDGSERTYTITVDKEAKKEVVKEETKEEENGNSQLEKTIIIILIILVIIGLLYLIFKKDDEEDIIVTSNKNNNNNKNSKK